MNQKSIVLLIEEMEKKRNAAEQGRKAVLKHNPSANVSRFIEHIDLCEKAISQLNRKLLNSEYTIDKHLLEYMLEELEMKKHLEKLKV